MKKTKTKDKGKIIRCIGIFTLGGEDAMIRFIDSFNNNASIKNIPINRASYFVPGQYYEINLEHNDKLGAYKVTGLNLINSEGRECFKVTLRGIKDSVLNTEVEIPLDDTDCIFNDNYILTFTSIKS